nr:pectinesterase inhibitor 10 isoform X1 [Zonotrichia albicollis]
MGSSPNRVPVSDTEAQGGLGSTKPRCPLGPACSARTLPPAPSPSACAAAPSLSPLSSARHSSSKMSAAPRPPLSPARPGAAPLARKISAVRSAADPAGPAPQQMLATFKLPQSVSSSRAINPQPFVNCSNLPQLRGSQRLSGCWRNTAMSGRSSPSPSLSGATSRQPRMSIRNFQHLRRVEETYFKCCMTNPQDGLTHFRLMPA